MRFRRSGFIAALMLIGSLFGLALPAHSGEPPLTPDDQKVIAAAKQIAAYELKGRPDDFEVFARNAQKMAPDIALPRLSYVVNEYEGFEHERYKYWLNQLKIIAERTNSARYLAIVKYYETRNGRLIFDRIGYFSKNKIFSQDEYLKIFTLMRACSSYSFHNYEQGFRSCVQLKHAAESGKGINRDEKIIALIPTCVD